MNITELLTALDAFNGPIPLDDLQRLLGQAELDCDEVRRHMKFSDDCYQRNPLRCCEHYQAFLLCWKAGQASPIHDHTGSGCGIHVVKGTLCERLYDFDADGILRAGVRNTMGPGEVCASFDDDKHVVMAEDEDLVTLHVYTPCMKTIGIYTEGSADVEAFTYPQFQEAAWA
ncbi:MAG: cysteine dioxygenase family protein [Phycisphaerales bacterium]